MSKSKILIVGASSDIGCELIRQLANARVVIYAHYHRRIEKLENIIREVAGTIVPVQADLAAPDGANTLVEKLILDGNSPNKIVFIAAPTLELKRFKDCTWSDFDKQLNVQLRSAMILLKELLPQMVREHSGRVVFVLTSYTTGIPPSSMAHYVTAKYAMLGLMKSLSSEYSSANITVNAISPSMVNSGYLDSIPAKIVELTAQRHPLKRIGLPSEIAPAIKFLLSDDAEYITGVNLPITGGG